MRIGIAVDYGKYANASSLNLIAKKVFLELGKIMNHTKNFTVAALKYEDIGIGDVNQHYDCICVPNMGGYKFPSQGVLTSHNLYIGLIGIDEVILREKSYRTEIDWQRSKPIIEREIPKWQKHIDKIKMIHVSTHSEKEQMIEYLKIPENKLCIIPLGVDHEKFHPINDKEIQRGKILGRFFIKDKSYFIHVSESNWARKNVLRILESFEKAKNSGIEHDLIIVGRAEPIIYEKANQINGVKVLGFVDEEDLVSLIQNADGMIFPSLHEGFGFPAVEAISCGVPVIASNVFSSPEIIGDGGLYVDPYDVNDITNKIIQLATDEKLREELSKRGYEQSKKYSWEKTSTQLLQLIKENSGTNVKFDFEKSYNISAQRTITTICETIPELMETARMDLLEFDYSKIIKWCLEVGLEDDKVRDFLIPFKDWLIMNSIGIQNR